MSSHPGFKPYPCSECSASFTRNVNLKLHFRKHRKLEEEHEEPPAKTVKLDEYNDVQSRLIHQNFNGMFRIFRITTDEHDFTAAFRSMKKKLIDIVREQAESKVQLRVTARFVKAIDEETRCEAHMNTRQMIVLRGGITEEQLDGAYEKLEDSIAKFEKQGSGWVLQRMLHLDLYVSRYRPIRATSYQPLPRELRDKHAIVNVQNKDDRCFMWSVLAALHPVENNPHRPSKYVKFVGMLDFTSIDFPVTVDDVPKFEDLNGLAVNVLGYENKEEGLYPLYVSKRRDREPVNLLRFKTSTGGHYCWIKNLDRLLFQETKTDHRKHICNYCLCPFNNVERLTKHQEFCTTEQQRIEMPFWC